MPVDFSLLGPAPRINTPFENLSQILQVRNQQEAGRGLAEQRSAIADERRQKADAARQEAQAAAQFKALWNRTDPSTGQPSMPTLEESASIIGPENAAKVFKGIEELQKMRWTNQQEAVNGIASLIDGIEAWPAADRQTPYTTVRQRLLDQQLIKPTDMPETYSAGWVAQKKREAMTTAQRIARDTPPADYTLGDQRISGATNQPIATAAPKPEKVTYGAPQTMVVNGRRSAVRAGSDGRMYDMNLKPIAGESIAPEPTAPRDERIVQIQGPNGAPIWVREGQAVGKPAAQAARAVTGAERQVISFFNRAKEAAETVAPFEDVIGQKSLAGQARLEYAPNWLQSPENQSYRQAQRAFTEARLRKESGAAIPPAEYTNDSKTYFAQPGDTPEILTQKRKARETVLDGLAFAAGKAYDEYYGEPRTPSGSAAPKKSNQPAAAASGPKIGDVVSVGGKRIKITAIHPDGTFDGDPVR